MAELLPSIPYDVKSISGLLYTDVITTGDVNNVIGNAIIQIRAGDADSNIKNIPVNDYGVLLCFANPLSNDVSSAYYRCQLFISQQKFYYRIFTSQWGVWYSI